MYRIGEFSKLTKTTVKALRFYDEAGLLKPAAVDEWTSYRYYTTKQLYPLRKIVALREAGFSIEEIKRIMSGNDAEGLFADKRAELERDKTLAEFKLKRLASIEKSFSEDKTMQYQAVIKNLPACIVYYKRGVIGGFGDISRFIRDCADEYAAANPDAGPAEPDYCFMSYLDGEYKDRKISVEYAQAVRKAGRETENLRLANA